MIEGLKPYPEYRESGLPWVGRIPAHWQMRRMKLLLREVDSRSTNGTERLLKVSQYTGVTERKSSDSSGGQHTRASSLRGYKRVSVDDIVINIMLAWNGSLGVSRFSGIVSPAYCVYRFQANAMPWYYQEMLRLPVYKERIKAASTGVVDSRLRLYSDELGNLEAIQPPLEEQAAIVRFLDHATRKIDRAIRAKRKLIALLNEQEQAIIQRAVTRGLDPTVPLKPSGVPWLGEIPEHWEVKRICQFARVGNGSTPSRSKPSYWSDGYYPWLNSSQVNRGFIASADQFVTEAALRECHLPRVSPGSLLVAITGQGKTRGTAAVLGIEATINQHIAHITPRTPEVSGDFLHLAFAAAYQELRALSEDSGSTKGALTCEDLKRFKVAIPTRPEQAEIVDCSRRETQSITNALSRAEREIALLREYRTRLVADVVTGRLDVREAARNLPDDEEPLPEAEEAEEDLGDEVDLDEEEDP